MNKISLKLYSDIVENTAEIQQKFDGPSFREGVYAAVKHIERQQEKNQSMIIDAKYKK